VFDLRFNYLPFWNLVVKSRHLFLCWYVLLIYFVTIRQQQNLISTKCMWFVINHVIRANHMINLITSPWVIVLKYYVLQKWLDLVIGLKLSKHCIRINWWRHKLLETWEYYFLAHVPKKNCSFNNIFQLYRDGQFLLVEETGVSGENHRPATSHWQTLSHNVVHLALDCRSRNDKRVCSICVSIISLFETWLSKVDIYFYVDMFYWNMHE
jgi:hypothetical protein